MMSLQQTKTISENRLTRWKEEQKIKCLILEAGSLELSEDKENFLKGKVYGDLDPSTDLSSVFMVNFSITPFFSKTLYTLMDSARPNFSLFCDFSNR